MRVWTNNQFAGHYPVGTAAVVVADTPERAAELLNNRLEEQKLGRPATADQFEALPVTQERVRVLCNGDY
jgi:hypothetical protein